MNKVKSSIKTISLFTLAMTLMSCTPVIHIGARHPRLTRCVQNPGSYAVVRTTNFKSNSKQFATNECQEIETAVIKDYEATRIEVDFNTICCEITIYPEPYKNGMEHGIVEIFRHLTGGDYFEEDVKIEYTSGINMCRFSFTSIYRLEYQW